MKRESQIKSEIVIYLRARGWLVENLVGNALQKGIPDLFLFHPDYGFRWVDVKRPKGWRLTSAQRHKWCWWYSKFGLGIYIMTGIHDYPKLFKPANILDYLDCTPRKTALEQMKEMNDSKGNDNKNKEENEKKE